MTPDEPVSQTAAAEARPLAAKLGRSLAGGVRLALFRRPRPDAFPACAETWLALVLIDLGANLLISFLRVGMQGELEIGALPRALVYVALALALGVAMARAAREPALALRVPVAVSALGVVLAPLALLLDLLASIPMVVLWLPNVWLHGAYLVFGWWLLALAVGVVRIAPPGPLARDRSVLYALVLLVLPAWFLPSPSLWTYRASGAQSAEPNPGLVTEAAFYRQPQLLEEALAAIAPSRPGVEDVYVLTAALYAGEDVFMKEVEVINDLLRERYRAEGRSVTLINNPSRVAQAPVASHTSLRRALAAIGMRMDPDEDVLLLYLTSHGSEQHRLSVTHWPLRLDTIGPQELLAALDDAGIRWRVIVVSACYSGGFVEPLKDDRTLVITAASASRQSFGCGAGSDFTYLAKALFDEELRRTVSLEQAFERARVSIAERERAQGFKPSEPQIHVGGSIRAKLARIESRLAAPEAAPR